MTLTAILARSDDGIIGIEGPQGPTLPWRLPPDLRRFRELTTGHAVIMGRVTYESIGRPLPNRWNIVVTREVRASVMAASGGLAFVPSPQDALDFASRFDPSPFVIGGAQIFNALRSSVTRIELTEVHVKVGGGVTAWLDPARWRETSRSDEQEHEGTRFHFVTLELKRP